jgi:glycosyltransferase involved in cell wall biosynthesis
VASYASILTGIPWTCSAHAKDIWTTPKRELKQKIAAARFVVTCTKAGLEYLAKVSGSRSKLSLSYHGIDLDRFMTFPGSRPMRNGSDKNDPVVILSVGRLVEKKGYDVLLRALALLPQGVAWRFVHVGGGAEHLGDLATLADALGIGDRIMWKGAQAQEDVVRHYREADLFALACKIARDGDRDGLPNVLVEAGSQKLACVTTEVAGVTEFLADGISGIVVEPGNPAVLAKALLRLIRDPEYRARLGEAAERIVRQRFDHQSSVRQLAQLFEDEWRSP